ncbi:hypothetical protein [Spirosoma sp.]|uniref:hypothetical protein n=1 Tax=Spirosoma sp. TaxID=1899569 RepID=UPI003B3A861D
MNQRIRPDDLQAAPYKDVILSLAAQWVQANLPSIGLTYSDYIRDIATLLLTTQSTGRTTGIVQAVLEQAISLHKSSTWVEQELKFEGMVDGADRADFLRLDLSQAREVDDTALDLYNERINRFSEHS